MPSVPITSDSFAEPSFRSDARARDLHVDLRDLAHAVHESLVVGHDLLAQPRRHRVQQQLLLRLRGLEEAVDLELI
jgi:hypothetical protein